MRNQFHGWTCVAVPAVLIMAFAGSARAQLRIVTYNDSGSNPGAGSGLSTILDTIGDESRNGISRPIDVISLQEQDTSLQSTQHVVDVLNSLYGADTYARSTVAGGGDTTQAIVYRKGSVQLIGQSAFLSTGISGAARQSLRFQLRPVGYTSSADFYLYSNHYKAGDSDAVRRNVEAQGVRANADALGTGVRAIYTGDFNIYGSNETMWGTLTAAGPGQGVDPVNRVGIWGSNSSFADVHTQSPAIGADQAYGGQTGGGMDDRFDWQLITNPVNSGHGFSYIANSYHAFGNAGVQYNGNVTAGGAASILKPNFPGYTDAQMQNVLIALQNSGDHLPVVADYRLPAKMSASFQPTPSQVIVGANVSATVNVSNVAPVQTANGADTLEFTVTGAGDAAGSVGGTATALGQAVNKSVALSTSTSGPKFAGVNVSSTSPGVANGTSNSVVSYVVLEHSNASFDANTNDDTRTVNLGVFQLNSGDQQQQIDLYNVLAGNGGPTAGLALVGIDATGDTTDLSAALSTFSNLTAGDGTTIVASLETDQMGVFQTTYTIHVSDQALPGATVGGDLTLVLTGTVVPEPASILLIPAVCGIAMRRRPVCL